MQCFRRAGATAATSATALATTAAAQGPRRTIIFKWTPKELPWKPSDPMKFGRNTPHTHAVTRQTWVMLAFIAGCMAFAVASNPDSAIVDAYMGTEDKR